MDKILRISFIQYDIIWEDANANFVKLDALISKEKKINADLLILPEMFNTGFSMNTAEISESMSGNSVKWMLQAAAKLGCHVMGSVVIKEKSKVFNRLLLVGPNGIIDFYDKKHLFTLAKEDKHFSAGKERKIFSIKAADQSLWKICPMICYDLRFPVWSRNDSNYDALVYVANFPEKRSFAWSQLLIARAIENQCYTIGVNRIGKDGLDIPYSGKSVVLDFKGKTILKSGSKEGIFSVELVKSKQKAFRRAYNFLADRDDFRLV